MNTTYQYDALNRLTQKSYSDGTTPTVTLSYDTSSPYYTNRTGRLAEASVPGWTFDYGYDAVGRLNDKDLRTPQNQLHYADYAYDLMGNMTSGTAGYGSAYYTYNTAGRLTSIASSYSDSYNPATPISNTHYNAFGGLTSDTLADGETESYTYVPKLTRLQSYTATLGSWNPYSFSITSFAPNGDILAANDSANGNWTYSYDAFNRLVGSNKNSGQSVFSYVYDRFGNRWQQNGPNSFIATFTGNNPGNPQNNNRMDGYSYDAAGNLLNDGSHNYKYDAENRLILVDNGSTATYVYDAESHRVQKTSAVGNLGDPAGSWIFFYDQAGRWVQKFNSPGNTFVQGNIFAGGRHLASETQGNTGFSHSDWLGTERVRNGFSSPTYPVETCASLPFGDALNCTSSDPSPLHFTGKERDSESGLDNFGARYDSSSLGRFMSPDPENSSGYDNPSDPQGWNAYSYVRNNPVNLTDPDGRDYRVCIDNGTGGQNCTTYANFNDFQKAAKASGATVSGDDKTGQILVNGQSIGSYNFFVGPGVEGAGVPEDNILAPVLFGGLFGGLKAGIRGLAEGLFGGGAKAAAEETTVAVVESTTSQVAQATLRTGGVIERVFQTSAGPVQVLAKVEAEGSTAVIKELAVYPAESNTAVSAGFTQTRQGIKAVLNELKEAGFTDFRMEPQYRIGGANAGGFTGTLKGKL